jgi:hypothetical protein
MIFIGNHNVVFFGTREHPLAVRWWAEAGVINYEDSRTNEFNFMSIRTFLERLQAISDMLEKGKRVANRGFMDPQEVERHMKFVEQAVGLVQRAKEQRAQLEGKTRPVVSTGISL